jgi:hypothetical protein
MIFDFLLFGLAMYLTIPFAVGYFAKCYGLKFWPWFWLCFFLPGLTHLILYFKVSSKNKRAALSRYEDHRMGFIIKDALKNKETRDEHTIDEFAHRTKRL